MIVLDTPPVLATADAGIVASLTDGVLLVVRAGATDRNAAQRACQHLGNVGARVIGTVLNDPGGAGRQGRRLLLPLRLRGGGAIARRRALTQRSAADRERTGGQRAPSACAPASRSGRLRRAAPQPAGSWATTEAGFTSMSSSIAPPEPRVAAPPGTQRMNIVIVGHVDHGKSTVIGRLLADTHSLPEGKLEQIRAQCELNSKPFEYAFLLDALKDEQAQGITIDAARVFFKSSAAAVPDPRRAGPHRVPQEHDHRRRPRRGRAAGHRRRRRRPGELPPPRLHGVAARHPPARGGGEQDGPGRAGTARVYDRIVREYGAFLDQVGIRPSALHPGLRRAAATTSPTARANLPWYDGPTVLDALDAFHSEPAPVDRAVPHAGPGRLQVHQAGRRPAHRGGDHRLRLGEAWATR